MREPLLQDEQVIISRRAHPLTIVGPISGYIVGGIVAEFLLIFIGSHATFSGTGGLAHVPGILRIVEWLIPLLCIVSSLGKWMVWKSYNVTLTNHRILLTRGIASRSSISIGLDRIQDTIVRQSFTQRLVNCGTVEIDSAARNGTELLTMIPRPQEFANAVISATEAHRGRMIPPRPSV